MGIDMSDVEIAREGGCLCGAIRYRLRGDPLTLYCCHCTDCQKQSASAFSMSLTVRREQLELLKGTPLTATQTFPEDGRQKHGRHCGHCGSRVWTEFSKHPHIVNVRAGTLDDTSWLRPIAHTFTRSAQPWLELPAEIPSFEAAPDDLMDLVRAYQARERRARA
jgi:hypothetical protein